MDTLDNLRRLELWWIRWEVATGQEPDIRRHVRQSGRGLVWPVEWAGGWLRPKGDEEHSSDMDEHI